MEPGKFLTQEFKISRKQIVSWQICQRYEAYFLNFRRTRFEVAETQSFSQGGKPLNWNAAKIKVQPVRAGFFRDIGDSVDYEGV